MLNYCKIQNKLKIIQKVLDKIFKIFINYQIFKTDYNFQIKIKFKIGWKKDKYLFRFSTGIKLFKLMKKQFKI